MSKVLGILVKILAFLTMPTHQIWSCHVTQEANFENFLFFPNSTFNIKKSHKISSGKALYFKSCQQKTHPPSAFRIKILLTWNYRHTRNSFPRYAPLDQPPRETPQFK